MVTIALMRSASDGVLPVVGSVVTSPLVAGMVISFVATLAAAAGLYRLVRYDDGRPTARLAVLEETSDGFVIAERDLEVRGPGDLLGVRQSGLPALRVADPVSDLPRLAEARREARRRVEAGEAIESDLFGR